MANNGIVNSLTFTGAVQGSATIQAQSVAGSLTFLLPNQVPTALQILTAQSINGNVVTFGWSAPQSAPSFSSITGSLALSQIAQGGASLNDVIQWNGTAWAASASAPGSGTVTSVALTAPAEFTVGGSPITTSGTLAITKATQLQNLVWASPNGSTGVPVFRALVAADIPTLNQNTTGTAANLSGTPALPNGTTATTQTALDASTKLATTAYADAAVGVETSRATTAEGLLVPKTTTVNGHALSSNVTVAFADLGGSLAVSQINSKVGTGNAVQLSNTGQTIVAGDVLTYTADGSVQDSGTLLTSLAPKASPTFTGVVSATHIQATSGSDLLIDALSTNGVRIADNGNARGILVGGTAGVGHIWLWSPAGSTLVDVSDASVAITGASIFTSGAGQTVATFNCTGGFPVIVNGNGGVALQVNGELNIANNQTLLMGTSGHLFLSTSSLNDSTAATGTSGQVLTSTGTATLWATDNDLTSLDGAGNPVVLQSDNHLATGSATLTTGSVTVTLTGNSVYSAAGVYSVQVTRTNTPGGAGTGLLWVTNTDGAHFTITSTDATDSTSTLAWTAIGY